MVRRVTATEARVHLGALLRAVSDRGETVAIEQNGRLVALLTPPNSAAIGPTPPVDAGWQAWWDLCAEGPAAQVADWRALAEESYDR